MNTGPTTDQMGRQVDVPAAPQRIISLVPSITELLFDLGLGNRMVGVTRFCIHPLEARQNCANIGGTKQLHLDRIAELKPDLIIGNKEENTKDEIEQLLAVHTVWMSDVNTVPEGIEMIRKVGQICGVSEPAEQMATQVEGEFKALELSQQRIAPRVAYLIWYDPIMGCGNNNFIHDLISRCGWINILDNLDSGQSTRYPEVSESTLRELHPDFILLSSEPYPFKQKHANELAQRLPGVKMELVDGELFSWYGSRMLKMPQYLMQLQKQLSRAGRVE